MPRKKKPASGQDLAAAVLAAHGGYVPVVRVQGKDGKDLGTARAELVREIA